MMKLETRALQEQPCLFLPIQNEFLLIWIPMLSTAFYFLVLLLAWGDESDMEGVRSLNEIA